MKLIGVLGLLTLIALNADVVSAWDQDEIDIYDLVEEIGIDKNFYIILKVEQVIIGFCFVSIHLIKVICVIYIKN